MASLPFFLARLVPADQTRGKIETRVGMLVAASWLDNYADDIDPDVEACRSTGLRV